MFGIALALLQTVAVQKSAPRARCQLHHPTAASTQWEGSCGPLFDQTPTLTLAPAKAITTGRWRGDAQPLQVWAGNIMDDGDKAAIELEVYPRGRSVLRTPYGWYNVPSYDEQPNELLFEIDTSRTVPPSDLDRAITKRADAMLSSVAVWNRADNRQCAPTATTWSIYCAMEQASIEVAGGAHHRRPAMEVVRVLVEQRTATRNYKHRLMDYNNDSTTTLADVHRLFADALAQMNATSATLPSPTPAPAQQDLRVVERAQTLLNSADHWNRAETQDCAAAAKNFGIYCALKRATEDVVGTFDGESAVLNDARAVVDFMAAKQYGARLVDYNNDPATSFADVQAFLRILRNRVVRRMAS